MNAYGQPDCKISVFFDDFPYNKITVKTMKRESENSKHEEENEKVKTEN